MPASTCSRQAGLDVSHKSGFALQSLQPLNFSCTVDVRASELGNWPESATILKGSWTGGGGEMTLSNDTFIDNIVERSRRAAE